MKRISMLIFLIFSFLIVTQAKEADAVEESAKGNVMEKSKKEEAVQEWAAVMKDHPKFARAFLAQQAILIEASEYNYPFLEAKMCRLIELGFIVPFAEYWNERCNRVRPIEVGGIIGCLANARRDPGDCFPEKGDWFDDPFTGRRMQPPLSPSK